VADAPGSLGSFARVAAAIVRKDAAIEMRGRELVYTTLFFAVACVLVFSFGLVEQGRAPLGVSAGILWIAIAFSGTLALGRTFDRERTSATLPVLLLAPADRPAVYVGKLAGIVALMLTVEVAVVPLVSLFFGAPFWQAPFHFAGLLLTGTVGFAAVGTLFAAMLVGTRGRDILLPILLYPITVPVIIAGVRGTAAVLEGADALPMARAWLAMLGFFDVVFVTLALWTFESAVTE